MILVNNCQLKQFYQECQKDKYIAIDTEFYWTKTYKAVPCLIQISNSKRAILIDLISENLELAYLKKILSNKKIIKIFHSARQDLEILFNLFNELPNSIFDTQIGVMPLGYEISISLEKLCKYYLAIKLSKKNQRFDWRTRPLKESQIIYALNDVKYLYLIYEKVINDLKKLDRIEWTYERHKKLLDINLYSKKEKLAWKKIKFKPKSNIELILLKKISEFRENKAKILNVPPKEIVVDSSIMKLCEKGLNENERTIILEKINNPEIAYEILKIFKNIKIKKELLKNQNLSEEQKKKYIILKRLLIQTSLSLKVHPNLIANKFELEELIKGNSSDLFNGWKYKVFGKHCIKFL